MRSCRISYEAKAQCSSDWPVGSLYNWIVGSEMHHCPFSERLDELGAHSILLVGGSIGWNLAKDLALIWTFPARIYDSFTNQNQHSEKVSHNYS